LFLNILAAVDGSASSRRALAQAVDLAHRMNAVLTLITVAPPTAPFVPMAGVSGETMRAELDEWAAEVLREAAAAVPDEVIVHTIQRCGSAGHEILEEIERSGHDLVVLGSRGRGRAQEGLLGSVNGYLHFHCGIALLSVPEAPG
jgi:nucleotide-binding universal stress UspA family protein